MIYPSGPFVGPKGFVQWEYHGKEFGGGHIWWMKTEHANEGAAAKLATKVIRGNEAAYAVSREVLGALLELGDAMDGRVGIGSIAPISADAANRAWVALVSGFTLFKFGRHEFNFIWQMEGALLATTLSQEKRRKAGLFIPARKTRSKESNFVYMRVPQRTGRAEEF